MRELTLASVYFIVALGAMIVSRETGGVALFWPANAIAIATICRIEEAKTVPCLVACGVAYTSASLLFGTDMSVAVLLCAANMIEIVGCVWIARLANSRFEHHPHFGFAIGYLTQIVGPVMIAAIVSASVISISGNLAFIDILIRWWAAEALGLLIFFGPVFLYRYNQILELSFTKWIEFVGLVTLCGLVCHFYPLHQINFATQLLMLVFFWCAFRLNPFFVGALSALLATALLLRANMNLETPTIAAQLIQEYQLSAFSVIFSATILAHTIAAARASQNRIEGKAQALAQTNADMSTLLHIVSHDLKSPLMTIQGFSALLQQYLGMDKLDRAKHASNRILEGARIMAALIDDTLELSRVKHNRFNEDDVVVADLVEETKRLLALKINAKQAVVRTIGDQALFRGDRSKLIRSLLNLIGNALDYACPRPNMKITVGVIDGENWVKIFVKDEGPGIGDADQDRLFELFYRGSDDGNGTGAGLAIVKQAIERHGGKVWVHSKESAGATFWMSIPKDLAACPKPDRPSLPIRRSA